MFRRFFLRVLFLAGGFLVSSTGQTPEHPALDPVALEQERIQFVLDHLRLPQELSQQFEPLYREYRMKMGPLLAEKHRIHQQIRKIRQEQASLSEEEADRLYRALMQNEQQRYRLRWEYYTRFRQILPASQVLRLMRLEKEFNRKVKEKLHQKQGHPQPPSDTK